MREFFKGWRRKAGCVTLVIGCLFTAYLVHSHLNRPFATANRFVDCIRAGRIDEAKAMIEPTDREKIPEGYWDQFRNRKPVFLASPTPLVFSHGLMAIVVGPPSDGPGMDIRYEVAGRRIRVVEITGELPE